MAPRLSRHGDTTPWVNKVGVLKKEEADVITLLHKCVCVCEREGGREGEMSSFSSPYLSSYFSSFSLLIY